MRAGRRGRADGGRARHHRRSATPIRPSSRAISRRTRRTSRHLKSSRRHAGAGPSTTLVPRLREGERLKVPKACPFDCIKTCDVTHSSLLHHAGPSLQRIQGENCQNGYAFSGNAWRGRKASGRCAMRWLRSQVEVRQFPRRRGNFSSVNQSGLRGKSRGCLESAP